MLFRSSTKGTITTYVLQMLGILVSFFDDDGRVKVEFLKAISLVTVDSESVCKAILNVLDKRDISYDNLVSILMDSCNIMRG